MPFRELLSVLALQGGYNTVVVMLGAAALGVACGAVGTFTVLRRQALVSDAVAHATLPGVAGGFIIAVAFGFSGRTPVFLMAGALTTAALAMAAIQWLARQPRVSDDTAVASVLAGGFALGIALLSIVQTLPTAGQAGLDAYLLGAAAGMLASEAMTVAVLALAIVAVVTLVWKELAAIAFDPTFAEASGLPVRRLDGLVALLSLATIVVGLRIVGLVLIVALLIIPAAAARFWSHSLACVVAFAAAFGAVSAYVGAALSAVAPGLPTGAVIVLTAGSLFALSVLAGPARGLIPRALATRRRSTAAGAPP